MSHYLPPPPGYGPPIPPPKHNTGKVLAMVFSGIFGLIVVGSCMAAVSSSDDDKPKAAVSTSHAVSAPQEEEEEGEGEETTPETVYATLGADDFTIELRTTSKQCFGSAGCNVTVEPELTYTGLTEDIDPDATYEITYEIRGDDSGPVTDTLELTGGEDYTASTRFLSTASSGTKVTVKITDVITR